jgi:RNA polymerase sigma-70 factor (ECF subfamily)
MVDADATLVEKMRAGDEAAFREIVRRYQDRLVRLAESTVGSRAVAQEVTQDTWLAVLRGVDRFEGRSTFKTWLFNILMNRARSAVHKESRAGRPDENVGDERFDKNGAWVNPPEPWSDRVDDRIVANDLAHRLRGLLPQLPDQQRAVITLRDIEGVSAEQVASMLGLSEGNQRVLLHRGRARLRSLLNEEMVG